ncbi:PTS-dependent dihydroxyacetone kinase phosphotransferase subunit DhaM [Pseudoflavonifractor phocaeensis]|uniref:dihydroxyacetone kinase phosphoryl donor subunit DhaM n=1 Tax=Pseudoflavonifractor phocaeensis TaxID=1870988 RepID=UPI00195709CC|nr:dihydroxyacetone kinase phosphoryl donor subunit DhaM [Pseudoflavonifractor phocaeensis]MBM6870645.1 PTS-dependent dihydroxyacetone kinase phosphotransferase subunit DhaM [Pseudoflavonifractor phocaeensis]MBM6937173.1 PTS-dependent dihydroxyacetone kinase phosphotransferase subunit DhaM [Pseudoflavonifractor phocaeensis]
MVGVVIVSHSEKVAEGARELALQMAGQVPVAAAGGLPDGGIGTDFQRILEAVESVSSPDGVVILFDVGSALMTAEMVVEAVDGVKVRLADGPVVEGAIVAAVSASIGMDLEGILAAVRQVAEGHKL